jgi:hypothetical protein
VWKVEPSIDSIACFVEQTTEFFENSEGTVLRSLGSARFSILYANKFVKVKFF